jgi:hypothetical protein
MYRTAGLDEAGMSNGRREYGRNRWRLFRLSRIQAKERLINSVIVIPAKAGIQENQKHGYRLSPV